MGQIFKALVDRVGMMTLFAASLVAISAVSQAAADWTSIAVQDNRLDVAGTADFVDAVRVRQSAAVYEELWNVPGGFLHYQAPTRAGSGADRFAAPVLAREFTLILNAVGAPAKH